jgi:Flp pilus assembly protein TadB
MTHDTMLQRFLIAAFLILLTAGVIQTLRFLRWLIHENVTIYHRLVVNKRRQHAVKELDNQLPSFLRGLDMRVLIATETIARTEKQTSDHSKRVPTLYVV